MAEETEVIKSEIKAKAPTPVWKSFVSGGVGGMCLVAAGHPFDLIKVRLQTMQVKPGQAPPFTGALDCARQTVARDGFRGLYRGMSAPLMGVTPIFAVCFWGYDVGKKMMMSLRGVNSEDQLTLTDISIAGAFSAVPTTAIMAPGERIKCILQTQDSVNPRYKGPVDVVKGLYAEGGLRSIFRGSYATLLRDGFGSMAYFGVYEFIKRAYSGDGSFSAVGTILGGGFAGVCNWLVAIPFDTVKSRLQTAETGTYSGIMDCTRKLIATEGYKAFFKGVAPALLRAFPANAACFLGVESAMNALNKMFPDE